MSIRVKIRLKSVRYVHLYKNCRHGVKSADFVTMAVGISKSRWLRVPLDVDCGVLIHVSLLWNYMANIYRVDITMVFLQLFMERPYRIT